MFGKKKKKKSETTEIIVRDKKTKKLGRKQLILIAAGIVAAIVIVVAVVIIIANALKDNHFYFASGEKLYYSEEKDSSIELMNGNYCGDGPFVESADGKFVFYCGDYNSETGEYTLYCRKIGKNKTATRVDSNVLTVDAYKKDGAIYTKEDGIYSFSVKNGSVLLAANAVNYSVSDNKKYIAYTDAEDNLYIKKGNKEAELCDREISDICLVKDNGAVYYIKSEVLYEKKFDKDKVKLCSDVLCYEKGESGEWFYFSTYEEENLPLADMIADSTLLSDSEILEAPAEPVRPSRVEYGNTDQYEEAYEEYENACAEYEKDLITYNAKIARDTLRQQAEEKTVTFRTYNIHYFDGKSETNVAQSCNASFYIADNKATGVFYYGISEDRLQPDLAEYNDIDALAAAALESYEPTPFVGLLNGKTSSETGKRDGSCFEFSESGDTVYFMDIDDVDGMGGYGTLYKSDLTGKSSDDYTVVDADVYFDGENICGYFDDGFCYYIKNKTNGNKGNLCKDGEQVDTDVYIAKFGYSEKTKKLYYFADYSETKGMGTLKYAKGKNAKKVSDDVNSFIITKCGNIAYIKDYSADSDCGKLIFGKKQLTADAKLIHNS